MAFADAPLVEAVPLRDVYKLVDDTGGLEERLAGTVFAQMLDAIRSIHAVGLTHCDLGLESFIFNSAQELKLIHLQHSHQHHWNEARREFDRSSRPEYQGTNVLYAAPEAQGGFEADMWALGICLF